MVARYNADLANDLGNLVSRTLAMVASYFDGVVPAPGETTEAERALGQRAAQAAAGLDLGVEALDPAGALESVMSLARATNLSINEAAPWKLARDPSPDARERLATVLYWATEAIRHLSVLFSPAMPAASRRIRTQLGLPDVEHRPLADALAWGDLAAGTKVNRGEAVFPRLEAQA
jgi:methionyl-tRNA synthetase